MLALLAALVLAQEVVPTAPSELPPPPPPPVVRPAPPAPPPTTPPGDLSTVPPLPEGPLLAVARSDRGETFLVVGRAARDGDTADFWTYEVFQPPVEISPGVLAVQGLAHHAANCDAKTDQTIASAGYDESGTPVVALAASGQTPIAVGSAYGMITDVVCRGVPLPKAGQIKGHAAALAQARQPAGG